MHMNTRPTHALRRHTVAFAVDADSAPEDRAVPLSVLGAIEAGRELGWNMVDLGQWHMQIPQSLKPDGLLFYLNKERAVDARKLMLAVGPAVSLTSAWGPADQIPTVLRDEQATGLQAANYLLERGFRNFAICGFKRAGLAQRLIVFQKYIRQNGHACTRIPALRATSRDETTKGEHFKRELAKLNLPLAIFCVNDRLAVRVCRWCIDAGLEIPQQVAILGAHNDILACECSPVPISSIDMSCKQRGREAAYLLQRLMNGEKQQTSPILIPPGEVVTRRSTDILAIPDLAAAQALRYMWDHYTENIGGAEIAKACGTPRRTLDRHFHEAIGRTLNQELNRKRLSHACALLATTNLSTADIAAQAGFHSEQYFCAKFKRAQGCSPNAYRNTQRTQNPLEPKP